MLKRPSFYIALAALLLVAAYWAANHHAETSRSFLTAKPQ